MSNGQTVNLEEAADLMKVHPKTVVDYINSGALPAARIGRGYVMLASDVMALVVRHIAQQTAERMRRTIAPANEASYMPRPRRRRVGR